MKYRTLDEWNRAANEYEQSGSGGTAQDFLFGNRESVVSDLLESEFGPVERESYNRELVRREVEALKEEDHIKNWSTLIQGKDKGKLTADLNQKIRGERDQRNIALSLGMSALNEVNGNLIVERRPKTPTEREVRQYLSDEMGTGLTSSLAGVGLNQSEKTLVKGDKARALDRAMELWCGIQPSAGYPLSGVPSAGGHLISRKWSNDMGIPEQITARHNMEFEGDKDNETRGEHRGKYAADLSFKRFLTYLDESDLTTEQKDQIFYCIDNIGTTPEWM